MILRRLRPRLPPATLRLPSRPATRSLIAAPKPDSGPLMSRRADRELPALATPNRWARTIPLFALVLGACTAAIFNYQKLSSPVVASALYALRTSAAARARLGDEIYFASKVPWVRGTINQLGGRIDIAFRVRGTAGEAVMRFASDREGRMGFFQTREWSLVMPDGEVVQLLDKDGPDPFKGDADGVQVEVQ